MTGLLNSKRRQKNGGFTSPSGEQAEPMRQRLKMSCSGKKDPESMPEQTQPCLSSRVKGTFCQFVGDLQVGVNVFH